VPTGPDPFEIELAFTDDDGSSSTFPLISPVAPGLFLGGARAPGLIELPQEIDHVARLVEGHFYDPHPGVLSSTVLPLRDSLDQGLAPAWPLAERLAAISEHENLLIHCQFGLNRSAAVMSRVLMLRCDWDADRAIAHLRAKRSPHVLFNESFVAQLHEL